MAKRKFVMCSRYNYPAHAGISFTKPSMTQQQFRDESDMNNIVRSALNTGDMSVFQPDQRAEFYDCTDFEDYQTSLNFLRDVEDDFESLPAKTRKLFGNNVDRYVQFMVDPANHAKAIEIGLLSGPENQKSPSGSSGPQPSAASAAAATPPVATPAASAAGSPAPSGSPSAT